MNNPAAAATTGAPKIHILACNTPPRVMTTHHTAQSISAGRFDFHATGRAQSKAGRAGIQAPPRLSKRTSQPRWGFDAQSGTSSLTVALSPGWPPGKYPRIVTASEKSASGFTAAIAPAAIAIATTAEGTIHALGHCRLRQSSPSTHASVHTARLPPSVNQVNLDHTFSFDPKNTAPASAMDIAARGASAGSSNEAKARVAGTKIPAGRTQR